MLDKLKAVAISSPSEAVLSVAAWTRLLQALALESFTSATRSVETDRP